MNNCKQLVLFSFTVLLFFLPVQVQAQSDRIDAQGILINDSRANDGDTLSAPQWHTDTFFANQDESNASPAVVPPNQAAPIDQTVEPPRREQRSRRNQGQDPLKGRISVGSKIADFDDLVVYQPDGSPTTLAKLVPKDGRIVLITGCLTCPKFLMSHRDIEAIAHDYKSTGHPVSFVYLYKSLAHPENGGWIQPFTLQERLSQINAAQKQLKNKIPFVADPIDNRVSTVLGGSPNAAYVLQSDGTIDYVSGWADGPKLRAALGDLVGPTETISTPESIGVPPFSRPYRNTGTVVPRIQVPGTMIALKTEPQKSEQEFYVKLRAEVDPSVLQGQDGKMYIGFHLDTVHGVHWNNLVDPVKFTLKASEGIEITPLNGAGPKVEPATDSDPREFLLDVSNWPIGTPIEFDVMYYACSAKEGWCKPVSQTYRVTLERDRAGGMAQGRWNRGGGQGQRGERRGDRGMDRGQQGSDQDAGQMISRMDRDGDGKIALDEAPQRMQQRFEMFDANSDGYLDAAEFQTMIDRRRQRSGGGGRPPR
ncbi:MAG: hypothetical protein P8J86_06970 [Phycisphaerales bacterium]|nr:hypothetical protein [Phycisphaerales bacterium]